MNAHLSKILSFEAAHRNPLGGAAQQRLHGHSYQVELLAQGAVDSALGWVVDYADLKRLFGPVHRQLDHSYLNELSGLEADSTLHALERWILERMAPSPPWFEGVRVSILGDLAFRPVRLAADPTPRLPERIRFSFEAAQSLPHLPEGHPCRHIHGHSYYIEIGTRDMERLEPDLAHLYDTLDHRFLNEIEGLDRATSEIMGQWVWRWLEAHGHRPTVVVVQETFTARCAYFGD